MSSYFHAKMFFSTKDKAVSHFLAIM